MANLMCVVPSRVMAHQLSLSGLAPPSWKAILDVKANPVPLLWHRRLSTLVREMLLVLGRGHRALDQQLPAWAHQGLGDTLSSAPMLVCEQQCRGLALQLTSQSWESGLRRGALEAARLGAPYIRNLRSEICSDVPKICYLPSDLVHRSVVTDGDPVFGLRRIHVLGFSAQ